VTSSLISFSNKEKMQSLEFDQFFQSVFLISIGTEVVMKSYQLVAGGNINNAVKLETDHGDFFLKWNESAEEDFFTKEAQGLSMLRATKAVKTPRVIGEGIAQQKPFLLLQYLQPYPASGQYWTILGTSLAALHRHTNRQFGLSNNNYIGSLIQKNNFANDWIDFFVENRLEVQLGLAFYNGLITRSFMEKFRRIYAVLPGAIPTESPALLHGDLWSGNLVASRKGPFFVDPAVYYGHREMDLAFTLLFGYFEKQFYQAYNEAFPLETGFEERADLYNLYPLLVHTNLFGTSYLAGIERTLRKYL
jgi:fructosamine-3-kinase